MIPVTISSFDEAYKSLSPEAWVDLRRLIPEMPEAKPDFSYETLWVDYSQLRALSAAGLRLNIQSDELVSRTGSVILKLADRLERAGLDRHSETVKALAAGCAAQIHVPDFGLLLIDEVDVLTDCCTDDLRGRLDQGWRILAVCPPNAQRRPDYVIGRRKRV